MENLSDVFNKIVSSSKMSFANNPYDKIGGIKEFDDDVEKVNSQLAKNNEQREFRYNQVRFIIRSLTKNLVLTSRGFKTDTIDRMPKLFSTKKDARDYMIQVYKIDLLTSTSFVIDKVVVSVGLVL